MAEAGGGSAYLMGTRNKGSPAAGAPRGRLRAFPGLGDTDRDTHTPGNPPWPPPMRWSRGGRAAGNSAGAQRGAGTATASLPPGTPGHPLGSPARPQPPSPGAEMEEGMEQSHCPAPGRGMRAQPRGGGGDQARRGGKGAKLLPHRFVLRKMQR